MGRQKIDRLDWRLVDWSSCFYTASSRHRRLRLFFFLRRLFSRSHAHKHTVISLGDILLLLYSMPPTEPLQTSFSFFIFLFLSRFLLGRSLERTEQTNWHWHWRRSCARPSKIISCKQVGSLLFRFYIGNPFLLLA